MHFALARAYMRAGRKEDADRENEIFKKLQEKYNQQADAKQTVALQAHPLLNPVRRISIEQLNKVINAPATATESRLIHRKNQVMNRSIKIIRCSP
jgi:hypothetical protein